jgi:transcriptional regulator with XRE-family HTH domain
MTTGEKIRHFRLIKGLSQENLAEMLNMSVSGYAQIERNEVDVKISKLELIAEKLGTSILDILGYETDNYFNIQNNHQPHSFVGLTNNTLYINQGIEALQHEIDALKVRLAALEQKSE